MGLARATYRAAARFVGLFGFELAVRRRAETCPGYEPVLPHATYAPWRLDKIFEKAYLIVKDYTMVDIYRCYDLWRLVEETAKLSGALIEVGVWRGGSGALIARKAQAIGIRNNVYLCDTFTGVVKASQKDPAYRGNEHADTSNDMVEEVLGKLGLHNAKILEGVFPEETGKSIDDEVFRFCHIDVDVYESARDVFEWVWPKLVTGGIVVFDDYGFRSCEGVTRFVNDVRSGVDRVFIHNLNGHAVLVKIG
jgi:O-methyltransferase